MTGRRDDSWRDTAPKTNMDTQNDGLEKVTPFRHGNCWYLCWISGVYISVMNHALVDSCWSVGVMGQQLEMFDKNKANNKGLVLLLLSVCQ